MLFLGLWVLEVPEQFMNASLLDGCFVSFPRGILEAQESLPKSPSRGVGSTEQLQLRVMTELGSLSASIEETET